MGCVGCEGTRYCWICMKFNGAGGFNRLQRSSRDQWFLFNIWKFQYWTRSTYEGLVASPHQCHEWVSVLPSDHSNEKEPIRTLMYHPDTNTPVQYSCSNSSCHSLHCSSLSSTSILPPAEPTDRTVQSWPSPSNTYPKTSVLSSKGARIIWGYQLCTWRVHSPSNTYPKSSMRSSKRVGIFWQLAMHTKSTSSMSLNPHDIQAHLLIFVLLTIASSMRWSCSWLLHEACPGNELKDAGINVCQVVMILVRCGFGVWDGVVHRSDGP